MSQWGESQGPYWRYPRVDATPFDKREADYWHSWTGRSAWTAPPPPESGVEEA